MVKKKRPPFTQLGGVNKAVLGLQGLTSNRRALAPVLLQEALWLLRLLPLLLLHTEFKGGKVKRAEEGGGGSSTTTGALAGHFLLLFSLHF